MHLQESWGRPVCNQKENNPFYPHHRPGCHLCMGHAMLAACVSPPGPFCCSWRIGKAHFAFTMGCECGGISSGSVPYIVWEHGPTQIPASPLLPVHTGPAVIPVCRPWKLSLKWSPPPSLEHICKEVCGEMGGLIGREAARCWGWSREAARHCAPAGISFGPCDIPA